MLLFNSRNLKPFVNKIFINQRITWILNFVCNKKQTKLRNILKSIYQILRTFCWMQRQCRQIIYERLNALFAYISGEALSVFAINDVPCRGMFLLTMNHRERSCLDPHSTMLYSSARSVRIREDIIQNAMVLMVELRALI